MWPLERLTTKELLRLGCHAAERWEEGPGGLRCTAVAQWPRRDGASRMAGLPAVLRALYDNQPQGAVTVVLESAWMPLVLIETGGQVWAPAPVRALVRHRLGLLHGERDVAPDAWDVRVDHRPGDRCVLGYGLAPQVRQVLLEAAGSLGLRWAALVPAWAWGWQRVRPDRSWPGKTGHWAWLEQDRLVLGSFEAGRLVGLNPAARLCSSASELEQLVEADAIRRGQPGIQGRIAAASWRAASSTPPSTERTRWHVLAAQSASTMGSAEKAAA